MSADAVRQQVLGILAGNGVPVKETDDGQFVVPAPGEDASAVVFIGVHGSGSDASVVTLMSPVLREVDGGGRKRTKILEHVNAWNCSTRFSKCAYYEADEMIGLEYELFADDLQESELMRSLLTLANAADELDDDLQQVVGGKRVMGDDAAVA